MTNNNEQRMTIDQSKEYLVAFMERHFTDKTFQRYIRGERGQINLAGDFAWQMARALSMIEGAHATHEPAALASVQSAEPVAWANWRVGTKSYVPYRDREDAEACVKRSRISATQDGPYRVVPLYPPVAPAEQPQADHPKDMSEAKRLIVQLRARVEELQAERHVLSDDATRYRALFADCHVHSLAVMEGEEFGWESRTKAQADAILDAAIALLSTAPQEAKDKP